MRPKKFLVGFRKKNQPGCQVSSFLPPPYSNVLIFHNTISENTTIVLVAKDYGNVGILYCLTRREGCCNYWVSIVHFIIPATYFHPVISMISN
jgi:hypothetical protein